MRLVIFDFDGTIHLKETLRLYLKVLSQTDKTRKKLRKFYITTAWAYVLYRFGLGRELMIKLGLGGTAKIMRGMSRSEIEGFFEKCLKLAKADFSPISLRRIKMHIDSGDRILLLSGAFSHFISLVAQELGMQYWLGTELELSADSCTGRIQSQLVGASKVRALQAFLQKQKSSGTVSDLGQSYAYADGIRDLPLLLLVGHPVAVNPDHKLLKEAQKRGWEIIVDASV